jgi:hypothetical protein
MLAGEALAMRDLGESAGDARDSAVRGIEAFMAETRLRLGSREPGPGRTHL